ncbi:MAG: CDP-glucose 4,6-dehydratase [Bacteroidota bacterium]
MFGNIYQNKKVLVTGDTGFKGSWLCSWLLLMEANVYGLAMDIPTEPAMFSVNDLDKRVKHTFADIRDLKAMAHIIGSIKPDFIFHLAAQPIVKASYDDPVTTMSTNIMGTTHVLEAIRQSNHPCNVVMITSDKCYDNVEWVWGYREHDALGGKDPYSASKGAAEIVIKTYYHSYFKKPESPVKLCSVRAGNVIGGGDWAANRIVPDCIKAWSEGNAVEIRSPQSTRPWQHVLEPLSGYLRAGQMLAIQSNLNGESYNFGPSADQNQSVLELLTALSTYWHFQAGAEKYKVYENPGFHEAGLLKLNCDKALAQLQWKPTLTFEQTTRMTANWYDAYYNNSGTDMAAFTAAQIEEYIQFAKTVNQAWTL